jgi:hypothetical protein
MLDKIKIFGRRQQFSHYANDYVPDETPYNETPYYQINRINLLLNLFSQDAISNCVAMPTRAGKGQ